MMGSNLTKFRAGIFAYVAISTLAITNARFVGYEKIYIETLVMRHTYSFEKIL